MSSRQQEERVMVVDRIKTQAMMCNYGLPDGLNVDGRTLKAIRELWVRLDLFIATGEDSQGTIDYPEAKRLIEYQFVGKRPSQSSVRFKALVPPSRRRT